MTQKTATQTKTQVDVGRAMPQFRLPDSDSTAEMAMIQALDFCAHKMNLDDAHQVLARLQQGDRNACQYCHYSLAKQVAESLGALDDQVKAAYVVDYDATPEDLCFCDGSPTALIHLIIWAGRKSNALDSLVKALDHAMTQHYADMIGAPGLAHLLDVQIVDDNDVQNRLGYGAMLASLYNRPIQIWER